MPALINNEVSDGMNMLQSENGLLSISPYPVAGEEESDLINGGMKTFTTVPGLLF